MSKKTYIQLATESLQDVVGVQPSLGRFDQFEASQVPLTPVTTVPRANVCERPCKADEVGRLFEKYRDQWRRETRIVSSVTAVVAHPAYQAIIAIGAPVVPFILADLRRRPYLWGPALSAITGHQPTFSPDVIGRVDLMAAYWLKWAEDNPSVCLWSSLSAVGP